MFSKSVVYFASSYENPETSADKNALNSAIKKFLFAITWSFASALLLSTPACSGNTITLAELSPSSIIFIN